MKINVPGTAAAIEYDGGGSLKEALVATDKQLLKSHVGATLAGDGERIDFHQHLDPDSEVELIPWDAEEAGWI